MAFTGQLYQLESKNQQAVGAYVGVNGPWDSYGVIRSSDKKENGLFLNLIRGVKRRQAEKVVCNF